jgi:protein O-mannosyl-transferase
VTDDLSLSAPAERRAMRLAALSAFAAAAAVYVGTALVLSWTSGRTFGFVNYDDVEMTGPANPAIGRGLLHGLAELLDPVRSPQFGHAWLPLYYASLGLDHALGGGAAWVFHLHNVLLHALGAAMVVLIARRLQPSAFVAGLAGVLFAVHPAATESVAWVSSRKDALSFVWMAAAALCYLDGVARRRPRLHALGALCLVVSMTAKATTFVLPLLLLLHAFLLRRDDARPRDRLRPVVPYAVVAALMVALHFWVASREGTAGGAEAAGLAQILDADLQVAWRYAVALFAPVVQSVEHGLELGAVDSAQAVKGGAILVAWAIAVAATWRRSRAAAAALLAVPFALLPFNNVLPRTTVLFAERYVYVALLPFSIAVACLLRPRGGAGSRSVGAVLVPVALAALCAIRLPVWTDSVALWEDADQKAPQSSFVQCQLAQAYEESARRSVAGEAAAANAKAEAAWRHAKDLARTEVRHRQAESGLGTFLLVTAAGAKDPAAQVKEAESNLESAAARGASLSGPGARADRVQDLRNLAACRRQLGDGAGALAAWEQVVRTDERCAEAWNELAVLYFSGGRTKEGAEALEKSAGAAPDDPAIVRERVRVRLAAGDAAGARRDYANAISAHPADESLLVDAARLDALWLRPVDAEVKLRKALELRPDDDTARDLLAAALLDQAQSQAARDDMSAAREAARKAAEVVPKSSAPEQVLGIVARRAGDLEEAATHLRKARDLHPEGTRIREQLASVLVELAVKLLGESREGLALMLLEEAVATGADAVATPRGRVDSGVSGWPAPVAGDDRATVARCAALKGLAYLGAGRPADALPELTIAEAGTAGGDAAMRRVVLRLVVRARFALGKTDDAVAAAAEFTSLEIPGDAEWTWRRHAERAAAFVERGLARRGAQDTAGADADFRAAREAFDAAHAAGMPEWRLHVRRGEILFAEEDFLAATKEYDRAAELAPAEADPLLDRAKVWQTLYLLEEDKAYLTQAEADFRRAAEVAGSDPRVLAGLGETLVLAQKPGDAFPWLQKAVLADPSQAAARKMLADLAIRAGRSHLEKAAGASGAALQQSLADARAAADRAVALDPPAPDALVFLGDVLRRQGDWSAALGRYQAARERFPDSTVPLDALAKFHMDRGHLNLLAKRRAEAIADFRTALGVPRTTIDLAPARDRLHDVAVATYSEAMDLDAAGKFAESAERFALSLQAESTAEGHFARAVVLGKAERPEEAVTEYDAALAADPALLKARLNRASTLLRLGRLDAAAADFRAWLDAAPPDDPRRRAAQTQLDWIEKERKRPGDGPPK